jgi:hypothetical protein
MRRACSIAVFALLGCTRGSAGSNQRTREPAEPSPAIAALEPAPIVIDESPPPHDVPRPESGASAAGTPPSVPSPTPDAAALTGTWAGTYFYSMSNSTGGAVGSVAFFAELTIDRDKVRGSVIEPNTIGDRSSNELRANIEGTIGEDGVVRFVKTYDGTGGVAHSVEYVGRLDHVTQQIDGVWKATGSEGRFIMRRHNRLPELARR